MPLPNIRKRGTLPSLANNPLDSSLNYVFRQGYHLDYFSGELRPYVVDLWYEKPLFGRVDEKQNIVTPNKALLRPLRGATTHYALNFVADAFNDMKENFLDALARGRLSSDSYLSSFEPTRGWVDLDGLYVVYLKEAYKNIARDLNRRSKYTTIYNFDSFLEHIFLKRNIFGYGRPLTRINFITTDRVSVNCSGLAVEIDSSLKKSDDLDKEFFTTDANYKFVLFNARKFGFYVDKNCPWRFIANPRSTVMKPYMKKYNFGDYIDLFRDGYTRAYLKDYSMFKDVVRSFYTSYAKPNPTFDFATECGTVDNPKSRVYRFKRDVITSGVSEEQMFDYYLLSRFLEDNNDLPGSLKRVKDFHKHTKRMKTVTEKLAFLNEQLNKHVDLYTLRQPRLEDWPGGVLEEEGPSAQEADVMGLQGSAATAQQPEEQVTLSQEEAIMRELYGPGGRDYSGGGSGGY